MHKMFARIERAIDSNKPRRKVQKQEDSAHEEEKRRKEKIKARAFANSVLPEDSDRKASPTRNDAENAGSHEQHEPKERRRHHSSREPGHSSVSTQPPQLPNIDTRSHGSPHRRQQTQYQSKLDPYSDKPLPRPSEAPEQEVNPQAPEVGNHGIGTFYDSDDKVITQPPKAKRSRSGSRRTQLGDMTGVNGMPNVSSADRHLRKTEDVKNKSTKGEGTPSRKILTTDGKRLMNPETVKPLSASKEDDRFVEKTTPSLNETVPSFKEARSSLEGTVSSSDEATSSFDETTPSFNESRRKSKGTTPLPGEAKSSREETIPSLGATLLSPEEVLPSMGEPLPFLEDRKHANMQIRLNIYKRILQFKKENDKIFRHGLSKGWIMEDIEEVIEDLITAIESKKNAITDLENDRNNEMRSDKESKQRMGTQILQFNIENPTVFRRSLDKRWIMEDMEEVIDDLIKAFEKKAATIKILQTEKEDELAKFKTQHDLILETTKTSLREAHSFNVIEQQKTWNDEKSKLEKEVSELRRVARQNELDQQKRDFEANNSNDKKFREMESRHKKLLGEKEQQLTSATTRYEDLTEAYGIKIAEMQTKCEGQVKDAQKEGKDNAKKIEDFYKGRIQEEEEKAQDLCRVHANEKDQINAHHTEKYNKLSSVHEAEKQTYEGRLFQAQQDIEGLGHQHEYEKAQLNATHLEVLDRVRNQYQAELDQRVENLEKEKRALESQLATIRQDHSNEIGQITDAHNVTVKSMKQEHEKKMYQLFVGDSFKNMSDGDLADAFRDLVDDIEYYAQVSWTTSLERTWPIPDGAFSGSSNREEDQQFLFQNTIWTVLYERMFCNPFQVLGEEGARLHQQWLTKFGGQAKGSIDQGPAATRSSEEWRFETLRKCADVIREPPEPTNPYRKAKKGYETTIKNTRDEILRELGSFAPVTASTEIEFEGVVKKAAAFWLEVGQQRYRLFLVFSETGAEPVRSGRFVATKNGNIQQLVIIPELRRRGNAQGDKLDSDEMVTKCKGDFQEFLF